jgi:hypothetical protein
MGNADCIESVCDFFVINFFDEKNGVHPPC